MDIAIAHSDIFDGAILQAGGLSSLSACMNHKRGWEKYCGME
jgi:hypothetical protein